MKYIETTELYYHGSGHIIWNIFELCCPDVTLMRFRKITNYILLHTLQKEEYVAAVIDNCTYNIGIYQAINEKRAVKLMVKKIEYVKGVYLC